MQSKSLFSPLRLAVITALLAATGAMAQSPAAGQSGPSASRAGGLAAKQVGGSGGGGGVVVPYTCATSSITGKKNCTCTDYMQCHYLKAEQTCTGPVVEGNGKAIYNDCTTK